MSDKSPLMRQVPDSLFTAGDTRVNSHDQCGEQAQDSLTQANILESLDSLPNLCRVSESQMTQMIHCRWKVYSISSVAHEQDDTHNHTQDFLQMENTISWNDIIFGANPIKLLFWPLKQGQGQKKILTRWGRKWPKSPPINSPEGGYFRQWMTMRSEWELKEVKF